MVGTPKKSLRSWESKDGNGVEKRRVSWGIAGIQPPVRVARAAPSYFAFRCYSEIVANRTVLWLVAFLLYLYPRPASFFHGTSYPTRCFINENEGATYIFLDPAFLYLCSLRFFFLLCISRVFWRRSFSLATDVHQLCSFLTSCRFAQRHFRYHSRR